jgi:glycosyltransferase involved in cell wall biosynthesis
MNTIYLTIIIPCYNEKKTIIRIINQIKNLKRIKKQIILVDDGSNDGTKQLIKTKLQNKVDKIIFHKSNKGKGAAIISSIKYIKGNLVIIQDADLEYNPKNYVKLIKPFLNHKTKVVYGSRVLGRKKNINVFNLNDFSKNFRIFGNFILTKISNFINNQSLTDVHTCYKIFRKDVFLKLKIAEKDFSFCPEVTTKLSKFSYQIIEIPIDYNGRDIKDGKKIRFIDAIRALNTIIKYKYFNI